MDIPVDGLALPVDDSADVLALLPPYVRRSFSAPVRDALVAALTEIFLEYQRRASQSAGLGDILRSERHPLEGIGADHRVLKQTGESNDDYRARILSITNLVTPEVIVGAVNKLLAPFTTIKAKYFESELDAWFVTDGTTSFDSFVFVEGSAQASPFYPDRFYPDDALDPDVNDGVFLESREVLGAWVFADNHGRYFVLRLPPIEGIDDEGTYAFSDTAVADGMFVADGSDASGSESDGSVTSFIFVDQTLSDEVYAAIVSTVETLRGQGIRWQGYVDPLLN